MNMDRLGMLFGYSVQEHSCTLLHVRTGAMNGNRGVHHRRGRVGQCCSAQRDRQNDVGLSTRGDNSAMFGGVLDGWCLVVFNICQVARGG